MFVSLIAFIVILIVLVLAHELGHFVTAKASGIKVEEFALGFPPRLLSIRRGETLYSLNAIPLGGFTKMAGEEDPSVSRSFASKGIATRLLVLSAGSLMNLLLPIFLFSIALMIPHDLIIAQVKIADVAVDSPAARAGIKPGDTLLQIEGKPVRNIGELHRYTQLALGKEITVLVKRSDSTMDSVRVVPRWQPPEGQGAMGITVAASSSTIIRQREPLWRAVPMGVEECIETFVLFKNEIIGWFIRGAIPVVTGPVGIVQITSMVAKAGIGPLLEFAGFLSINLAVINLFPLPALDGGRIAFVLLEWLRRGKRIPAKTEGLIHLIGFAMLMGVILLITYRDILRIIAGESLLP